MNAVIACFALGVWWLQQQAVLPSLAPSALWLWALPACALLALRRMAPSLLQVDVSRAIAWLLACAGAGLLGYGWAAGVAHLRMADRLAADLEGRDLAVVGVVAGLPAIGERSVRFEFDVESSAGDAAGLPRRVLLAWYRSAYRDRAGQDAAAAGLDDPAGVQPGERWAFTVRLKRPHGNLNPHGFDYEAWLLERGIGATGYVRQRGAATRLGARNGLGDRIEQARAAVRSRFLAVLGDTPTAGVLVALAVGDQRAIGAADWRLFSRTGVTHLMSISGLHVTLISGLAAALVSFAWRRSEGLALLLLARKAAAAAALFAALGYTLLAGFGVPAQRTFFMVATVAAALWIGRIAAPSRVLALALLAVLSNDPWAVLAPGFWLSFGAVALIFYVTQGWTGREMRLAQWGRIQWAITLGLAPAALLLFGQVSLVGPLANAIAIPLVSAIITPLVLLAAIAPVDALLALADRLVGLLMVFLTWCDALPLALWQQSAPAPWSVLAASVGVAWLLAPRGMPSRWAGLLLFLPALCLQPPRPAQGEAWVTFLDVGQGLAVLVRTADHALLYDAGPAWGGESDSGERIVVPYLRAVGASHLDLMILTHNDADHTGGAQSVLLNAQVGSVLSSQALVEPIAAQAPFTRRCVRGEGWEWNGVAFSLLHPGIEEIRSRGIKNNDLSCVLRIRSAHGAVLLTGDIEKTSEALLVARASRADPSSAPEPADPAAADDAGLRAEVLLVPHHGSRTSSSPAFVAAVNPLIAVVAAGHRNRFGHPRADVLERYADAGSQVLRTDRDGAIHVRLAGGAVQAQGERAARPRYWRASRL